MGPAHRLFRTALLSTAVVAGSASAQTPVGPSGDEFQVNVITTGAQTTPGLAARSDGNFIVVWRDVAEPGVDERISARQFDETGAATTSQLSVTPPMTSVRPWPDVAVLADGKSVTVWEAPCCFADEGRGIGARLFDSNGSAVGTEFLVNSITSGDQRNPAVSALADGGFVVVWDSAPYPTAYAGIRARIFSSTGMPSGTEFKVTTGLDGGQYYADVAGLHGGGFITAYADYGPDGNDSGVFGRRYDSDGTPASARFQVNTYTTSYQTGPSVAVHDDDSFVIAWVSGYQDGDYDGIFGQRFDSIAGRVGTEFQINEITTQYQGGVEVAADGDRSFTAVWFNNTNAGSPRASDIAARQFDKSAVPLTSEFQVNQFTTNYQSYPSVVAIGADRFVVAWHDFGGEDGDSAGIFARLLAPPVLCGDANGDGSLSATDALAVLRTSVGAATCALSACDVNDSGGVTATDALIILKSAVGQSVVLNCPTAG
jgi:hypothetical protein